MPDIGPGGPRRRLYISASPSGNWYIPNATYEEFFDGRDAVLVGARVAEPAVLLTPTQPGSPDAYPLRDTGEYGRQFKCRAILSELAEHSSVHLSESTRLEPSWRDDARETVLATFPDHAAEQ